MIDLYTWRAPNGLKVSIMLEETGLPYRVHPINLQKDEQKTPAFLALNPFGKIPLIVDDDGPGGKPLQLNESGAILLYLAEKVESPLLPSDPAARYTVLQWFIVQLAGMGPTAGYVYQFLYNTEGKHPFAKGFVLADIKRYYEHVERRLGESEFLGGATYSVADISTYPFVARHERHKLDLGDFPNIKSWFDKVSARPAVAKGMAVPAE